VTIEDLGELDDAALVARHVVGDDGVAFGELFRRHRDRMYAVAIRTCGNREMAADAVQEAFVSAFRRADGYRGEAAVTTWLHRIVVNACLDRLRRERTASVRRAGDLGEIDLPDRHDHHAATETAIVVREALARLPEGQRTALVLVDMQGLSVAEAAQVLGVAEGTVKSRCFRGREALAGMLRPAADDPRREVLPGGPRAEGLGAAGPGAAGPRTGGPQAGAVGADGPTSAAERPEPQGAS
jgi:RNA polymerase sigma-70 factor (ECF subfamily)